MSDDRIPKQGEIWCRKDTGRKAAIVRYSERSLYGDDRVFYKYVDAKRAYSHTQTANAPRERFLGRFRPQYDLVDSAGPVDTIAVVPVETLKPTPWPQPLNTDTLSALAAAIRARAAKLPAIADREPWEQAMQAMYEIADALDSLSDGISFDRAAFLSMSVSKLLLQCRLAHTLEIAIRHLTDGEVYLDGVRVTEDAPITTVTRERFTVRCGERSAVVRVIG